MYKVKSIIEPVPILLKQYESYMDTESVAFFYFIHEKI